MLQILQWLYTYASSVYSKCFICFRRMLQVFHLNIAKVDMAVAYISVSGVFIGMLQVFHLDVCICLQWLHMCFQVSSGVLQVFRIYVASVLAVSDVCCKYFI
jgi:hypothetical protein